MSDPIKPNYIAGEWLAGQDAAPNINPSDTRDVIGQYARASQDQARTAIAAAHAAQPVWATGLTWGKLGPNRTRPGGLSWTGGGFVHTRVHAAHHGPGARSWPRWVTRLLTRRS